MNGRELPVGFGQLGLRVFLESVITTCGVAVSVRPPEDCEFLLGVTSCSYYRLRRKVITCGCRASPVVVDPVHVEGSPVVGVARYVETLLVEFQIKNFKAFRSFGWNSNL